MWKPVNEALMVISGTWIYWPGLPAATKLSDWHGNFMVLMTNSNQRVKIQRI